MGKVKSYMAKLFRGTAGSTAATEMKNVKSVTVSLEKGEADATTRATGGWKVYVGTLKDATVEFKMLHDTADADFTAIREAYLNGTAIALFPSDGNGDGLDGDFEITKFSEDQPDEDLISNSVTARLTVSDRAPAWSSGSGSGSGSGSESGSGSGSGSGE